MLEINENSFIVWNQTHEIDPLLSGVTYRFRIN